jgi:signal transduction histidine kinase
MVTSATLLLTGGAAWYAAVTARENDEARFENAVQHTRDAIEERVNVHLALLRSTAGLFGAEEGVGRDVFRKFAEQLKLEQNYPGLTGIGYARRVDGPDRESFVSEMREEHGASFEIRPGGERPVYFPVVYVAPANSVNAPAIGADLFAEPVRYRAMCYARDIGKAATSTKVILMQTGRPEERAGLVIYIPVFSGSHSPTNIWQRRAEIRGYVCGGFRTQDLFAGVFRSETKPSLHFDVYAGVLARKDNLLFSSRGRSSDQPLLTRSERLSVPGLTWTIVFNSTPAFEAASNRRWAFWISAFGLLMSALLFAAMEALAKAQRRAARNLALTNAVLERKVDERTARLSESLADLEHFSYSITHDMRAPLRAMRSYALLLVNEPDAIAAPVRNEYLRRIAAASQRMDQLIRDSLDYAKVMRDELDLNPVRPDVILREMIETYPAFHSPHARIELEQTFPPVLANEAGLTQCFSNILANAVKFVAAGKQPHVRIWAEPRGENVRICFRDNGIGIAAEHRDRIFGMFQQLHPAGQFEGTGIGLALVRKVTIRMQGRVGVDSEPGQGSTFWLEFAAAPVAVPVS